MKRIPYSHQYIDSVDIREVIKVLKSGWVTQGQKIKEFEDALCRYVGSRYAVAVSNGTVALHIACLAAGLKEGEEAITSPITFVASANCILYCGANPVFTDIQNDTLNIEPQDIKKKITKKTKAIIPVHFAGCPCDMDKIHKIARKYNLTVIEDAAHALGAEYKGSKIGSGKYSDMAIFSFHPVKSITTGEGGAILTNNKKLYEKLLLLRSHGVTNDDNNMILKEQSADNESLPQAKKNSSTKAAWYYEMQALGYNYRITDIQCALGLSQLRKLDRFLARRREIALRYNEVFTKSPYLITPYVPEDRCSAWHLYILRLRLDEMHKTRRQVFEELRSLGIGVHVHYIPLHLQPYYKDRFGYKRGDFPRAEAYYDSAITIPLFPAMSDVDCQRVIDGLLKTVR